MCTSPPHLHLWTAPDSAPPDWASQTDTAGFKLDSVRGPARLTQTQRHFEHLYYAFDALGVRLWLLWHVDLLAAGSSLPGFHWDDCVPATDFRSLMDRWWLDSWLPLRGRKKLQGMTASCQTQSLRWIQQGINSSYTTTSSQLHPGWPATTSNMDCTLMHQQ